MRQNTIHNIMVLIFLVVFTGIPSLTYSQGGFRFAHKQYERMKYAHAIEQYEKALKYQEPTQVVYRNLANSYYNVGDMKNAARVYKMFFNDATGAAEKDEQAVFEYAQTLAQNGRYDDAAIWFEKYHKLTGHRDERGTEFMNAYKENIHKFYEDSTLYSVKHLNINSAQSDFGPVLYGDGIVFCSARKMEHGVRRVHSWNNSAFLDLYYIDTLKLNEFEYDTDMTPEDSSHEIYSYSHANQKLHSDETHYTSNDSYTVGYHAHVYKGEKTTENPQTPTPFSSAINSKFHDGPATFSKDQQMIIFTRNNYNKGFSKKDDENVNRLKLYISHKKEDSTEWGKVTEYPYNSNEYSCGHPSLSADGLVLYFASDKPGGQGGSDLYKSYFRNGKWTKPVNLGKEINTEGNELFPFIDENNVLYFASNGHPGLGGLDLFKFEDGKLTHLNYPISSKKDDFGICVWDNGRKGFLSSNRDFGGYDDDIYMFTATKVLKLKGKVIDKITAKILPGSEVKLKDNTGQVIASAIADSLGRYQMELDYDKKYLVTGSRKRYFDSTETVSTFNIDGKEVEQDIFLWNKVDVALVGLVTDRETGKPLDSVKVVIKDKNTQKEIFTVQTLKDGKFREMLEELKLKDSISFNINLSREKYLTKNVAFNTMVSDTVVNLHNKLDLIMDKVELGTDIGELFDLQPIYFELGKWDITDNASKELDKMVEVMKENQGIIIELGAHTDCRASASYNMTLSDKRAKASADYIISNGIDKSRIYGKGYGESKLKNKCECEGSKVVPCTEEEHALNRRTEFVIVKTQGL